MICEPPPRRGGGEHIESKPITIANLSLRDPAASQEVEIKKHVHHDRESQSSSIKVSHRSRPARGPPPRGPEQGSSQESRESQSKIPTIALLDFRPSRRGLFETRSSIHREPMLSRLTETAAEKLPSARCKTAKRCCAVPQPRHFLSKASRPSKASGKCSVFEN